MIDGTGTEGQVGRDDDAGCDQGHWRAWRGERTRGRHLWLGRRGLASGRGGRTAAAAADLRGVEGRGPEEGPQLAEVAASLARQRTVQCAAGDGAQRRSSDGGCRRQGGGGLPVEGRVG